MAHPVESTPSRLDTLRLEGDSAIKNPSTPPTRDVDSMDQHPDTPTSENETCCLSRCLTCIKNAFVGLWNWLCGLCSSKDTSKESEAAKNELPKEKETTKQTAPLTTKEGKTNTHKIPMSEEVMAMELMAGILSQAGVSQEKILSQVGINKETLNWITAAGKLGLNAQDSAALGNIIGCTMAIMPHLQTRYKPIKNDDENTCKRYLFDLHTLHLPLLKAGKVLNNVEGSNKEEVAELIKMQPQFAQIAAQFKKDVSENVPTDEQVKQIVKDIQSQDEDDSLLSMVKGIVQDKNVTAALINYVNQVKTENGWTTI